MKVVALSCPQCGGTQEVPAQDEFLVCTYCQARLKVTRDDKGWLMKLLDETQRENRKLEAENEVLRLENAIKDLGKRWETLRETFLIKTKHGMREPTGAWGWGQVIAAIGFPLILWTAVEIRSKESEFLIFAIVGCAILVMRGWSEILSAREFAAARNSYELRRAGLSRELTKARAVLLDLTKLAALTGA
jgi:hypothetical protein